MISEKQLKMTIELNEQNIENIKEGVEWELENIEKELQNVMVNFDRDGKLDIGGLESKLKDLRALNQKLVEVQTINNVAKKFLGGDEK